jgi:glyoxylase-like metal-dependent hydrolase (beta-lactamase superfamily II)
MEYPVKLSERIFLLGNHYLSTYLVRGDRSSILIEPGISFTANSIIDQVKTLGFATGEITRLILTHAHADHITGAPVLAQAIPNLSVCSSAETVRLLQKKKVRETFYNDDAEIADRLRAMGEAGVSVDIKGSLGGLIDETIFPGETFDLGGIVLRIIDAPGHCLGGLALWEPDKKILFCSDYLGFFVPPNLVVPNFYVGLDDFMATFSLLAEMEPAWVCPGHCGAYSGEEAISFIDRSKRELAWITNRVLSNNQGVASGDGPLQDALFERYYNGEATMFSKEGTRYCMQLLIRRIRDGIT